MNNLNTEKKNCWYNADEYLHPNVKRLTIKQAYQKTEFMAIFK